MKKAGLAILIAWGCLTAVFPCSTHSVSTQAEVNLLSICTVMTGDLIIETGSASPDPITDLNSLQNLISVENLVIINNPSLQDISGLANLDTVRGHVEIRNNPLLAECCALNNLLSDGVIGGTILMTDNSIAGKCNDDGSNISACIIVPTLGVWSIFVLFLVIAILGTAALRNKPTTHFGY